MAPRAASRAVRVRRGEHRDGRGTREEWKDGKGGGGEKWNWRLWVWGRGTGCGASLEAEGWMEGRKEGANERVCEGCGAGSWPRTEQNRTEPSSFSFALYAVTLWNPRGGDGEEGRCVAWLSTVRYKRLNAPCTRPFSGTLRPNRWKRRPRANPPFRNIVSSRAWDMVVPVDRIGR